MEAMLEELFANDKRKIRITIFKDVSFLRRIWIYIKRLFSGTKGAWKVFGNYLVAWERLGRDRSSAFFRFDMAHEANCKGVVGVTRHREESVLVVDLPDINGIDLNCAEMGNKRTKIYKSVRLYMRNGYLGDDLETLKRINRKSLHIYGNVLSDRFGRFKGVLVIDSFHNQSPFDTKVIKNMPYYIKIISETL